MKRRMMKKVLAVITTVLMIVACASVGDISSRAATNVDLTSYISTSGNATATVLSSGQKPAVELVFSLPGNLDEKSELESAGVKSLSVTFSVSNYTAYSGETAGAMLFFMDNSSWTWNAGDWVNLSSGSITATIDMSSLNWGGGSKVGKLGLQICNLAEGSTLSYKIESASFSSDAASSGSSGSSGGSTGGTTVTIPSGTVTEYNYPEVEYNYAKLLQYSLYFYDANMCGDEVGEHSLHSWRDDCHTYDKYSYTRSDGSTVTVDLTGGFHDAGDHVKFGLPEAYAAFTLGMSYDTNKNAYVSAQQVEHLQTITTHFADYLVDCAVLNNAGTAVETYCVQVGNGGGGNDHGYWGAPENQPQGNRTAYFSSSSAPHTDIVSLSAAALAMQYKNFGGEEYLNTAKMLFTYAKNNSKSVGATSSTFYVSSNWEDDYCLAALMLYQVTGETEYLNEYNGIKTNAAAMKPYWPLGWDNVGPAVAYYAGDSSKLSTLMAIGDGNSIYGGYRCLQDWGSARYNTSMQYTGLLYDKMTDTSSYRSWAEGQMKYLMGNNAAKQCFIVGLNSFSPKYPHHRAASGYTGGDKGTTAQKYVLTGALVGGQKTDGTYVDSASDFICNEVAIDYNATLVAASAAIYEGHISESSTQKVDTNYHVDSSSGSGNTGGSNSGGVGGSTSENTGGSSSGSTGGTSSGNTGSSSGSTGGTSSGNTGNNSGSTGGTSSGNTGNNSGSTGGTSSGNTGSNSGNTGSGSGSTGGTSSGNTGSNSGSTGGTTSGNAGNSGSNAGNSSSSGDSSQITGGGNTGGTVGEVIERPDEFVAPDIEVSYRTHIQTFGWEDDGTMNTDLWKKDGAMSGTSGLAKRLEGINIVVESKDSSKPVNLGIQYTTHCQSYGWLPWSANGDMNGTEGEAKRLEAIKIQLTGSDAKYYDVYYRVHAQTYGWLGWAKNGEPSGTAGYSKRLEGIQIVVVKKDQNYDKNMGGITSKQADAYIAKPGGSPVLGYGSTDALNPVIPGQDTPNVTYKTHVQTFGWQGWKYNGDMSGTSGLAKRLEGINIKLTNKPYDGGIAYTTHVQTYGWQGDVKNPSTWRKNGEMSGTSGESKRLEAICITLTGEMAEHYDIYYRVHAQTFGWLGWARNGAESGTAGYSKRLEGIQIVLVPKGGTAPDINYGGIQSVRTEAYIAK